MSEDTQQATPADGGSNVGTFEDRVAAVNSALDAESQSAGDVTGAAPLPPAAAAPPSPADSDAEKRAAERRARLDALKESERQKVNLKAQQAAADKMQREYQQAMQRAEAAERAAQARLDPTLFNDPLDVIRELGRRGHDPHKVAEALRDSIQDPTIGASRAAREAVTPELQAMRQELAQTQEALRQMHEAMAAQRAAVEEQRHTEQFLGMVAQAQDRAPLAANLLAHDRDEFMEIAHIAAANVPGMGPEALLDAVEELLDSDVRRVAQKYAAIYGPPSNASAPLHPTRAAAKATTTVSNSAAQERASLLEEESFASLPIEERAARLIRSM